MMGQRRSWRRTIKNGRIFENTKYEMALQVLCKEQTASGILLPYNLKELFTRHHGSLNQGLPCTSHDDFLGQAVSHLHTMNQILVCLAFQVPEVDSCK